MSGESGESGYAFGDTDAAARRLEYLAEVFAVPSRSVLQALEGERIGLAVDLGCGPGHSTRLLAEELSPARLVGLDGSDVFLAQARRTDLPAHWVHHDVTVMPFPVGPADAIYARLVLAHLPEPEAVLERWLGQLAPGGYLVLEEDEEIRTDVEVLATYETMAAELVTARGGNLYIGRSLADLGWTGAETIVNRLFHHHVPPSVTARLFGMNFAVWRNDPHIRARHSAQALDRLAAELGTLAGEESEESPVDFVIRQVVLRKPEAVSTTTVR